jgi:hypothetical protein
VLDVEVVIDNVNGLVNSSWVSLQNGNIVFNFPPLDTSWGAENTSGFTYF